MLVTRLVHVRLLSLCDQVFRLPFRPRLPQKENPVVLLRVYVNGLLLRRFILNGDAGEDTLEVL